MAQTKFDKQVEESADSLVRGIGRILAGRDLDRFAPCFVGPGRRHSAACADAPDLHGTTVCTDRQPAAVRTHNTDLHRLVNVHLGRST